MNALVGTFCLACLGRQQYRAGFNPVRSVKKPCRVCKQGERQMDMTDIELLDLAKAVARMIVTEGDILTESQWARRVEDILREKMNRGLSTL